MATERELPSVDKSALQQAVIAALEALVENARAAMLRAYETATHEENIAENKYDTLGLEAAYLTEGQARRLAECEADLAAFRALSPRAFSDDEAIEIGALVELEDEEGRVQWVLLGPAAGGVKVTFQGREVVVVTGAAPLGKALLKAVSGDVVSVQQAARARQYEVVSVR